MNFMARPWLLVVLGSLLFFAGSWATADTLFSGLSPNDPVRNDVYVRLYQARWEAHKSQAVLVKAVSSEAAASLVNVMQLHDHNATSDEDLDVARQVATDAALAVEREAAMVEEAEIMLDIAVSRISLGVPMPICAEPGVAEK